MTDIWHNGFIGLAIMLLMGFVTWLYSLVKNDVSIVDSLWSLMFLAGAICYAFYADIFTDRNIILLTLIAIWAIRLSVFLTIRNWGKEEDRRYQDIRANNQPYFKFKSLSIIFGLQAVLAWIISIPLLFALSSPVDFHMLELFAVALWTAGFLFEAISDYQLYQFKRDPANEGKVLDSGLWAYSRHPNYFGEFLIWWAYFIFAFTAGAWWTIFSPLLMTLLLLKVSGVSLMEKDITGRRADYARYIATTNAFIPGKPVRQQSFSNGRTQS